MKKQVNYYATPTHPFNPNYKCETKHFTCVKKANNHIKKGGKIYRQLKDGKLKLHKEVKAVSLKES